MVKKKQATEKAKTVALINAIDDPDITELIVSKLGIEPNASGSRRRWNFLRIMAKHIYQQKSIGLNDFFKWTTSHCQCMKMRTLREDYLDTLELLGLITFDLSTGQIEWKGENSG
jgi:hypothetical protein